MLLEEAERLVERQLGADRVQRHLDDLPQRRRARVAAGRDDLAHERLPGHDAEEAPLVADEDRTHLRPVERLPGLLCARAPVELRRVDDHRIAHPVHQG